MVVLFGMFGLCLYILGQFVADVVYIFGQVLVSFEMVRSLRDNIWDD